MPCDMPGSSSAGVRVESAVGRADSAASAELVTAAFEFDRWLASARDTAAHCEGDPHFASALERLQKRSRVLMDYVRAVRRGDEPINAP